MAPIGRLSSHYERPDDCNGKLSRGQTGRGRINLDNTDSRVPALSDGAIDKRYEIADLNSKRYEFYCTSAMTFCG